MLRRLIVSHWTAVAVGFFLVAVHSVWLYNSEHQADVISGFGVSIAVLGILVTAQPLIRHGIRETARQQVGLLPQKDHELEAAADEAVRYVLKERVFGVGLIAAGTLLNGYAGALARLFSLKV